MHDDTRFRIGVAPAGRKAAPSRVLRVRRMHMNNRIPMWKRKIDAMGAYGPVPWRVRIVTICFNFAEAS
jgi:hypothetical protein